MVLIVVKFLISAGIITLASEIVKRMPKTGALISALPLVTILVMIWMNFEKAPKEKIATHSSYTFWYVLPSLPLFLIFPLLLKRLSFWPALGLSAVCCIVLFLITGFILKRFGIALF